MHLRRPDLHYETSSLKPMCFDGITDGMKDFGISAIPVASGVLGFS